MADLALVQLVPGPMTDNLERSLREAANHPWALDKFSSQMVGIEPGVYFVFIRLTLPNGKPLGKAGPIPLDAMAHRVVVGRVSSAITETSRPYFDGYPFEFRFDVESDDAIDPPVPLEGAAELLNERIAGLGMTADSLRRVISNARSAKVGMYFDGEPRFAEYFRKRHAVPAAPHAPAPPPSEPTTATPMATTEFGQAASEFASSVKSSGLVFAGLNEELPVAFLAALAAKRFAILTGMSGSGKTQLARALGQWLGTTAAHRNRYLVVPVRADWTSPEPLLGYEDALLPPAPDGRRAWSVPPALEMILAAAGEPGRPWLLVLDEMNLAHVERYFADVLSGIESGEAMVPNLHREPDGHWRRTPSGPDLVPLPSNLLIVGTVNIDETTYQFSPKVLDRAFSFEFRVGTEELQAGLLALGSMRPASADQAAAFSAMILDADWHVGHPHPSQDELVVAFLGVHEQLAVAGLEFGHRTFRESLRFAALLHEVGVADEDAVWDWVAMTKLLPRVHGSRRQLEGFLESTLDYARGADAEKPLRPRTYGKVSRMLSSVRANQFVSFSE